jgi:hypothetical protein
LERICRKIVVSAARRRISQRKESCQAARNDPAKMLASARGKVRSLTACSQASLFEVISFFKENS